MPARMPMAMIASSVMLCGSGLAVSVEERRPGEHLDVAREVPLADLLAHADEHDHDEHADDALLEREEIGDAAHPAHGACLSQCGAFKAGSLPPATPDVNGRGSRGKILYTRRGGGYDSRRRVISGGDGGDRGVRGERRPASRDARCTSGLLAALGRGRLLPDARLAAADGPRGAAVRAHRARDVRARRLGRDAPARRAVLRQAGAVLLGDRRCDPADGQRGAGGTRRLRASRDSSRCS